MLNAETRAALASRGLTVYLHADLEELLARTRNDTARPLLQGPGRAERLRRIVSEREPLYAQTAHLTIDTSRYPISEIVARIRQALT